MGIQPRRNWGVQWATHNEDATGIPESPWDTLRHDDQPLPYGYVADIAIENGPVEIVDFPIENGDFP